MSEYCIVNMSEMRIYAFINEQDAQKTIDRANAEALNSALRNERLIGTEKDADGFFTRMAKRARASIGNYVGMTYDEYLRNERERLLSDPVIEITKERFEEMLDVLPLLYYTTINGIEMFSTIEMYTGTYNTQYAHDHATNKYYSKMIDVRDKSTWMHNLIKR